jgi:hypothetical protein
MPAIALGDVNDFNNPSFELYYDVNESPDFNAPTNWERTNYTSVVSRFNYRGTNWRLDPNIGLIPYEGNYFVLLSSVNGGGFYSEIRQEITINADDRLTGAYFFGTDDYRPYDDWAVIQLVMPDTNDVVGPNIVDVNVADVQSYGSMRGWKRFDYVFDANQAGTYDLKIAVFDKSDTILASYFAVDGLLICPNSPVFGDINADCDINFLDFAMLANDWMCDCNDSSIFNDPNHNCVHGTDFDESNFVDFDDLQVIIDNWLLSAIHGVIEE